jgi:hypothetical protein
MFAESGRRMAHAQSVNCVIVLVLFYVDFVGVFVRILIILLENSENSKKEEKRKR